jgi:hypothetical protein
MATSSLLSGNKKYPRKWAFLFGYQLLPDWQGGITLPLTKA